MMSHKPVGQNGNGHPAVNPPSGPLATPGGGRTLPTPPGGRGTPGSSPNPLSPTAGRRLPTQPNGQHSPDTSGGTTQNNDNQNAGAGTGVTKAARSNSIHKRPLSTGNGNAMIKPKAQQSDSPQGRMMGKVGDLASPSGGSTSPAPPITRRPIPGPPQPSSNLNPINNNPGIRRPQSAMNDIRPGNQQTNDPKRPYSAMTQPVGSPPVGSPPATPPSKQARVLKEFIAQSGDQLSLKIGDTVTVLAQNDSGWWAGSAGGRVGQFPADHVELVKAGDLNIKPMAGGGNVISGVISRGPPPKRPSEDGTEKGEQYKPPNAKEEAGGDEKEKKARMRQQVISELVSTERDYLRDLELISTIFLFPLRTTAIVPESTIQAIFSNVEILQNVNKEFYQNLETRMKRHSDISASTPVGDLFKKMGDYFKMYTTYCANHPLAVQTSVKLEENNAEYKNFLKICHTDRAVEGFRLYDFLIKPVQRICKYPLLIRELLKFTEEDHEDYPLLVDAQKKIDEVVDYINEAKRNAEGNQIVVDIQIQTEGSKIVTPTRHLLKEGVMTLHEKSALGISKPSKVILFLFNDLVLVARPKNKKYFEKDKRQKNCFTQKAHIRLGTAKLIGVSVETEQGKVENCFEIKYIEEADEAGPSAAPGKQESVILSAASPEEEMTWTKEIKALIKEYQRKKYLEQQKAKAEAEGGGPAPITRSNSAVIDTSSLVPRSASEPRGSLLRMTSEPNVTSPGRGPLPVHHSPEPSPRPAAAPAPTTWSFSATTTPTRIRNQKLGGQRGFGSAMEQGKTGNN